MGLQNNWLYFNTFPVLHNKQNIIPIYPFNNWAFVLQNIIPVSNIFTVNMGKYIHVWNWSNTIHISSEKLLLVVWCFRTKASVAYNAPCTFQNGCHKRIPWLCWGNWDLNKKFWLTGNGKLVPKQPSNPTVPTMAATGTTGPPPVGAPPIARQFPPHTGMQQMAMNNTAPAPPFVYHGHQAQPLISYQSHAANGMPPGMAPFPWLPSLPTVSEVGPQQQLPQMLSPAPTHPPPTTSAA